jgi:hypothetical protein
MYAEFEAAVWGFDLAVGIDYCPRVRVLLEGLLTNAEHSTSPYQRRFERP